jgi:hypothetical protein
MPILLYEDDEIDPRLIPELRRQIGERKKLKGKKDKKGDKDPLAGKSGSEILQAYVGGGDPMDELMGPEYPLANRAPREINRFVSESLPNAARTFAGMAGPVAQGIAGLMPEPGSLVSERVHPEMAPPEPFSEFLSRSLGGEAGPAAAVAEVPPPERRGMAGAMAGAMGGPNATRAPMWRPRPAPAGPAPAPGFTPVPDGMLDEPTPDLPMMDHPLHGSEMADAQSTADFAAEIPVPEERGLFAKLRGMFDPSNPSGQALMAMGLGLLGGESRGGNIAPILARAGLGAMQTYGEAQAAESGAALNAEKMDLRRQEIDYLSKYKQSQIDQAKENEKGRSERAGDSNEQRRLDREAANQRARDRNAAAMERVTARAAGAGGGTSFKEPDYVRALQLTDQMIKDYSSLNPRVAIALQGVRDRVIARAPMSPSIFHKILSDATRLDPKETQTFAPMTGQPRGIGTQELVEKRFMQLRGQLGDEAALQQAKAEYGVDKKPPQAMAPEELEEEE